MNPIDPNDITSAVPTPATSGPDTTPAPAAPENSAPVPATQPDPAQVALAAARPIPADTAPATPAPPSATAPAPDAPLTPPPTTVWTPPPVAPPPPTGWSSPTTAAAAPMTPQDVAEPMTPPVFEATPAWAPAEPVVRDTTPPRRRGRLRWAAALAIVLLVVGASAAVASLLVGRSPDATILAYVPEQSVVYGELRLDLPGDQRQAAGQFLSKFPGFADQAALDSKLDEVLDQLVNDATKNEQSYTANIKPWFSGELGFAVGPLPDASKLTTDASAMASARALVLMSIKDPVAAQAWFDAAFKKSGATTSTETYNGATLTLITSPSRNGDQKAAFAILGGKVAVAGDETSVKAAVDTNGNSGFAAQPGPKAALAAADSDHIGFVYVALRELMTWSTSLSAALPGQTTSPVTSAISKSMLDMVPEWAAYWTRLESDAVVMEMVAPQPANATAVASDRTSTIIDHVPASAIALAISNDYGKSLTKALDAYRSDPSMKQLTDALDQALGLLGGSGSAVGWIGDTAVVVNVADGTPEGGLLVQPTNAQDAQRFFTSLKTLIGLGGQQLGASVHEETYNGTTITTIDLGKLSDLAGKLGGAAGAAGTPPMSGLPAGNLEISYATTDDLVVIGSGPAFVKHVLDTTTATSLGSTDRYKSLADRAGKGSTSAFVDIAAIRGLLEGAMAKEDPTSFSKYQKDVQPYLTPLDAMIASGSTQGDLTHGTIVITVK